MNVILAIGAVLAWIALMVLLGFGLPLWDSLAVVLAIFVVGASLWLLVSWFFMKQQVGQILLDIGTYPKTRQIRLGGGLSIGIGFFAGMADISRGRGLLQLLWPFMILVSGVAQVVLSFARLQIAENGIAFYMNLLKWKNIEAFEWTAGDEKDPTLKLRYKGWWLGFLHQEALPVPVEKKEALTALLAQYVPGLARSPQTH